MARCLRIECEGAIDHVTSRGDRPEPIDRDDADRTTRLDVIAQAMGRFDMAYREGSMTMTAVVQAVGLSVSRVCRLIATA